MKKIFLIITIIVQSSVCYTFTIDQRLKLIIKTFHLEPLDCNKKNSNALSELGEFYFKNEFLSGDESVSCQTCHLDHLTLTDGNSMPVGVGGKGEGSERLMSEGVLVKRNVITLFGRGNKSYKNFFWDGRVEKIDNIIYSPFGSYLPDGFNNALSVAAVLPLLERDEFVGDGFMSIENVISEKLDEKYYENALKAYNQVLPILFERLSNNKRHEFLELLKKHNSSLSIKDIKIWDIGNSIAEFIGINFPCEENKWEKYMKGDLEALNNEEKKGALLFYGKAKCSACHSGSFYTDFGFASIALPQNKYGPSLFNKDYGRARATNSFKDKHLFRTPSLRKVNKTSPYGHNGIFQDLKDIIKHHVNPIPFLYKSLKNSPNTFYKQGEIIGKRSDILAFEGITEDDEIDLVIKFIQTL